MKIGYHPVSHQVLKKINQTQQNPKDKPTVTQQELNVKNRNPRFGRLA